VAWLTMSGLGETVVGARTSKLSYLLARLGGGVNKHLLYAFATAILCWACLIAVEGLLIGAPSRCCSAFSVSNAPGPWNRNKFNRLFRVRAVEPGLAFGGPDGLSLIRPWLLDSADHEREQRQYEREHHDDREKRSNGGLRSQGRHRSRTPSQSHVYSSEYRKRKPYERKNRGNSSISVSSRSQRPSHMMSNKSSGGQESWSAPKYMPKYRERKPDARENRDASSVLRSRQQRPSRMMTNRSGGGQDRLSRAPGQRQAPRSTFRNFGFVEESSLSESSKQ